MAAIAPVVLLDGQSTPVSHTFNPVTIDAAGVAKWTDRVNGIALGYPALTLLVRNPTKDSRSFKVTCKVVTPILELTSPSTATGIQPAPTKAYDLLATLEFVLPERSSLAERQNLFAYVKNMFEDANLISAVTDNESVY